MTNEEKINRYCNSKFNPVGLTTRDTIKRHLLVIAKWKDKQYKEEKKELLSLVNLLHVDEYNQTIIEDLKALLK